MIKLIRRMLCFGLHKWEYSETLDIKECRKCGFITKLEILNG